MSNQMRVMVWFLGIVFVMTLPALIQADVMMKYKKSESGFKMMGQQQAGEEKIQTIWMTKNKMRSDEGNKSFIVRLDKNVMYVLDDSRKTYQAIPVGDKAEKGESKMSKEEQQQFLKFAEGMKMKVSVTATGESKKIDKWNCKKYIQTIATAMGPATSEIWATEDLDIDTDLYAEFTASMMSMAGGFSEMMKGMTEEMKKIKGVPVLTVTKSKMMNMEMSSTSQLIEFSETSIPADKFELPSGYQKKEFKGMPGGFQMK